MLTLEERERIAYITNAPEHPLIVLALESEDEQIDEMRHERDMAKDEVKDAEADVVKLEGELEQAEDKIVGLESDKAELEEKVKELEQQIHEAGVDLVV